MASTAVGASLLRGRLGLLAEAAGLRTGVRAPFDCAKYPSWCQAPFNCSNNSISNALSGGSLGRIARHPATWDGHANLNSWCDSTQYYSYMEQCIVNRDLKKAAVTLFDWSVAQKTGVDDYDASYCFMEGHCTNSAVTANTTLQEAEKMCDERYGHAGWAHWSPLVDEPGTVAGFFASGVTGALSMRKGFKDPKQTRMFLKLACAMGNYHCDVMYCKETYCQKKEYVNKYKHLAPTEKQHKDKERKHHHHDH